MREMATAAFDASFKEFNGDPEALLEDVVVGRANNDSTVSSAMLTPIPFRQFATILAP
jgi:hypothetical protein